MMRTSNPALSEKAFKDAIGTSGRPMTLDGTVNKTGILLVLAVLSALFTWNKFATDPASSMAWVLGGAIGGLVVALVLIFKKTLAPVLAPAYALLEGLVLGGVSAMYNAKFEGIVLQAVLLTFGTLFALLLAYRARIIRVTENFRLGLFAATGAIALVYLVGFVMSFFGKQIPYIHESGMIGIGFSLVVVVIAALNLVLDFDFIEQGVSQGAPKYLEWYAGFGLLVTLIWLYLEILRLLAKLNGRRN
ncbi:MAG: hypothetical protein RJA22_463 [Verrucomicrobiota bacterium]